MVYGMPSLPQCTLTSFSSDSAMVFVGQCSSLRTLCLGQARPQQPSGPFISFTRLSMLTSLTQLSLSVSGTASWQEKAAVLTARDLACISALQALQVLDLSHQPLLRAFGALRPLCSLPHLHSLSLCLQGCDWHLPCSTWAGVLATLTTLTHLDLSGCAMASHDFTVQDDLQDDLRGNLQDNLQDDLQEKVALPRGGLGSPGHTAGCAADQQQQGSGSDEAHQCPTTGFVEGVVVKAATKPQLGAEKRANQKVVLVPAPLHLLGGLVMLQSLSLGHWDLPPSRTGLQALGWLPALTSLDMSGFCVSVTTGSRGSSIISWQPPLHNGTMLSLILGLPSLMDLLELQTSPPSSQLQRALIAAGSGVGSSQSSTAPAAGLFGKLLQLSCSGASLVYCEQTWRQLQQLVHLNLSGSRRFKGQGLVQLQHLQALILM
eukprot:gene14650-14798_t